MVIFEPVPEMDSSVEGFEFAARFLRHTRSEIILVPVIVGDIGGIIRPLDLVWRFVDPGI